MEGPFAGAREKVNRMYAALNIYASLAEKAGMNLIKNDLENKAFEYLMPEEHNRITVQLKEREERDLGVLRQASSEVRQVRRSLGDTSWTCSFG
jgi:(p)ppGpp synthase/HD superfamily hydrolase